jgi:hypothetical protein
MDHKTPEVGVARRYGAAEARLGSSARLTVVLVLLSGLATASPLTGRNKDKVSYGEGLIVNLPMPEPVVEQVVEEVVQNGVIRGTKEYNKDEFIGGAKAASSSQVFPAWTEGGRVFYKVREQALDPRNFKDSSDVGTLVVRYVVQPQGEKNTVLRIDALFEETFRHIVHQSDGSVESAEYKDIHERLENIEVMQKQNAESEAERKELIAKRQRLAMQNNAAASTVNATAVNPSPANLSPANPWPGQPAAQDGESSSNSARQVVGPGSAQPAASGQAAAGQTLEERVKELRRQVQRVVKSPGAPLKSAPFHSAKTLQLMSTGTEVLILISTPYWYGVETHDGQHGWMMRDQVEVP